MSIRKPPIIEAPDPRLYLASHPVDPSYIPQLKDLVAAMRYYLTRSKKLVDTVGISAVQLGVPVRLIAVKRHDELIFLVNPIITGRSKTMFKSLEGCGSIGKGKIIFKVPRSMKIKVKGLDLTGSQVNYKARENDGTDLCATFQHEIDHLDGITIEQRGTLYGVVRRKK